jgi:hypothetical protein
MAILAAGDADFYQFTLGKHAFELGDQGDGGTFAADLKGVRHSLAEAAELGALGASEGSRRHGSRHDTCDGQGEDLKKSVFIAANRARLKPKHDAPNSLTATPLNIQRGRPNTSSIKIFLRFLIEIVRPAWDGVVKLKFKPGMKLGRKVNTRVIQPLDFSINDEK